MSSVQTTTTTMSKNTTLSIADRTVVQTLVQSMMDMNNRNDINASQYDERWGTYGHLYNAVVAFVYNQTGVDIAHKDWNLCGNETWADDIQVAIYNEVLSPTI